MRQSDTADMDASATTRDGVDADGGAGAEAAATPLLLPAGLNSAGEFCTIDGVCAPADGADKGQKTEDGGSGAAGDAAGDVAAGNAATRDAARHPSSDAERDRG